MSLLDQLRGIEARLADTALIMTGDTLRTPADPALAGYGDRVMKPSSTRRSTMRWAVGSGPYGVA